MEKQINKKNLLKDLGNFKEVKNITSYNGNKIPNQFILYFNNGEIFQSYESVIVLQLYNSDIIYLGDDWEYSTTTGKYRNLYLNMNKKEILKGIKENKIIIVKGL